MKKTATTIPEKGSNLVYAAASYLTICVLVAAVFLPAKVFAAQLSERSLTLGSSAGNTATTWTFTFDTAASTALNGISFQVCEDATGSCTTPNSWSNAGASFTSLTYNGGSQAGWALDNSAGHLRIKNNSSAQAVANPVVATFSDVTNPDTVNETFFVRVITYSGDDFTDAVDDGVVAASTAQQITVSADVDESLTFCVAESGISDSNCSGATGSAVSLGTLSASTTGASTSQIGVGTNAGSGYSVTIHGDTLTCNACAGSPTIDALTTQTASAFGQEQFGINLMNNADPDVGLDPDGDGSGSPTANYGTADQFRFVTGDSIAGHNAGDEFRRYHVSYIANITTATEAGNYSSVFTFIATATF